MCEKKKLKTPLTTEEIRVKCADNAKVAQKLENVRRSLKGLTTQVEKTYDFSLFLNEIEGEDDAS